MGLLDGKKGLVLNIANDRSIATHIASNAIEQGARKILEANARDCRAAQPASPLRSRRFDPAFRPRTGVVRSKEGGPNRVAGLSRRRR